jgi:hypothetical protein
MNHIVWLIIFFAFEVAIVIIAFRKIKSLASGDTAIFQNYYSWLWQTKKNAQKEQIRQLQYSQQMQQQYGQLPGAQTVLGSQPQLTGGQNNNQNLLLGQNNNFQQAQNMSWKPAQGAQYANNMAAQNAQIQQPAGNNWQANQNNNFQQAQNMNWQPATGAYQQQVMQNKDLSQQPVGGFNPAGQPTSNWQPNQSANFQQAQNQQFGQAGPVQQNPMQPQNPAQPQNGNFNPQA